MIKNMVKIYSLALLMNPQTLTGISIYTAAQYNSPSTPSLPAVQSNSVYISPPLQQLSLEIECAVCYNNFPTPLHADYNFCIRAPPPSFSPHISLLGYFDPTETGTTTTSRLLLLMMMIIIRRRDTVEWMNDWMDGLMDGYRWLDGGTGGDARE